MDAINQPPPKQQPNASLEAEQAAVARMSYEEEMAHWEKLVLAEGEKEKGRQGGGGSG